MLKLINNASRYPERTAIVDPKGRYSYADLLAQSARFAAAFLGDDEDLAGARVAYMVAPGYDYACVQWAIWRAGGVAVPICVSYPPPSIKYVVDDAEASLIVASAEYASITFPIAGERSIRHLIVPEITDDSRDLPDVPPDRNAMMLYTSGTTGRPKGVVTTHQNIEAQISMLVEAWHWQKSDHILNILPLHHVHGIINVQSCALWSGACCEYIGKFSPAGVFSAFNRGATNLFMAVPTIYYKLINYWDSLPDDQQAVLTASLQKFRLMVSGSAALPISTLEKWKRISGHTLLERYGMTEMGMAISNPYHGERRPGHIGQPLPGVTVRLVDEAGEEVAPGTSGEIQVKGPNVFTTYWNRPAATADTFTTDGWFKTGDIAVLEEGYYKILGRNSIDIIKSGGYKISALEIEELLRKYPGIKDCGVVGLPDAEWGELIAASLILDREIDLAQLKTWLREFLPNYKLPRRYIIQEDLPRNVMGKVTKNELKKLFN